VQETLQVHVPRSDIKRQVDLAEADIDELDLSPAQELRGGEALPQVVEVLSALAHPAPSRRA
jgi:hypothetical protein